MNKNSEFSCRAAGLTALVLCALLVPAPAAADDGVNATTRPPAAEQRRDNVWGTMDENIRMGNDPQTGDVIIRVTPKPQPKPRYGLPPITVEPHIAVEPRNERSD